VYTVALLASGGEACSGFLIADRLVMTARHCVSGVTRGTNQCPIASDAAAGSVDVPQAPVAASNVEVLDAPDIATSHSSPVKVDAVIVPPDTTGSPICGHDVALLHLVAPIPGGKSIAPRLDSAPSMGEPLTIVGYGYDGADTSSNGVRRRLDGASVSATGPILTDAGQVRAVESEFTVDKGPCGGDSGSPAIDAEGRAIGVMSRGQPTVCTSMIYERVDVFADWLVEQAVQAATNDGTDPPAWAVSGADASTEASTDTSDAADAGATGNPSSGGCSTIRGADAEGGLGVLAIAMVGVAVRLGQSRGADRRDRRAPQQRTSSRGCDPLEAANRE
jgi:V8-like Glu-specific endopeptidase